MNLPEWLAFLFLLQRGFGSNKLLGFVRTLSPGISLKNLLQVRSSEKLQCTTHRDPKAGWGSINIISGSEEQYRYSKGESHSPLEWDYCPNNCLGDNCLGQAFSTLARLPFWAGSVFVWEAFLCLVGWAAAPRPQPSRQQRSSFTHLVMRKINTVCWHCPVSPRGRITPGWHH